MHPSRCCSIFLVLCVAGFAAPAQAKGPGPATEYDRTRAAFEDHRAAALLLREYRPKLLAVRTMGAIASSIPGAAVVTAMTLTLTPQESSLSLEVSATQADVDTLSNSLVKDKVCRKPTVTAHPNAGGSAFNLSCQLAHDVPELTFDRALHDGAPHAEQNGEALPAPSAVPQQDAERLNEELPIESDQPGLEAEIRKTAEGLLLEPTITWGSPIPDQHYVVERLPLTITATADYQRLAVFLNGLWLGRRIVRPTVIRLTNPHQRDGHLLLDVKLTLEAYRYRYIQAEASEARRHLVAPPLEPAFGEYVYSPLGKRNPFQAPKGMMRAGAVRPLKGTECSDQKSFINGGLDSFELDDLQFLYARTGTSTPCAMFLDPHGGCHVARLRDPIGRLNGRLGHIMEHTVIVMEAYGARQSGRVYPDEVLMNRTEGVTPQPTFCPDPACSKGKGRARLSGTLLAEGYRFAALLFDGTNLWGADDQTNTLSKLALDGRVLGTYPASPIAGGMVVVGSHLWHVDYDGGTVVERNLSDGSVVASYPVGFDPRGLVFDGQNFWVIVEHDGTLVKLRPADGSILATYEVGDEPRRLISDGRNLWVSFTDADEVASIKLEDGSVVGRYPAGRRPDHLLLVHDQIWISNNQDTVTILNAADGRLIRTLTLEQPGSMAFDGTSVFIVSRDQRKVLKVRPQDGRVLESRMIGDDCRAQWPTDLLFDGTHLWVGFSKGQYGLSRL